jgi:hypothetical protein
MARGIQHVVKGAVAAAVVACGSATRAALPVELEVAVVQAAPFGAMQSWGKLLSEMDLARLRLRGAHHGDKPSITPTGVGSSQRFRVVGVLNHKDQLIVPGGAFGPGDSAKLKAFFESLPERVAEQGVERGIFGLTRPQFEEAFNDLSGAVHGSTKGVPLATAFAAMTASLTLPVELDAQARAAIDRAGPVAAELQGMTAGTALAIALRPAGLAIKPDQSHGRPLALHVVRISPKQEYWPTGWKPEQSARQVVPAMYRFTTIEISGFTLTQALEALAPHMGVPLVFDERMLAVRGIDPAKVQVKFPNSKTYIRRAVGSILSQARLAGDLRVDEAGRPFYWITQFGPDNPPAIGPDLAAAPESK